MLPSSSVMGRARTRVLLVDDDPAVRGTVGRQLEALGCDVVMAGSGGEAIQIAVRGPTPDILLADLQLPDMNGVAMARAVLADSPSTRVAYMSGSAPAVPLDPRTAPFLLKPFSMTVLAEALAGAIAGSAT
ncbi:MAG: hypothetical protein A3F70_17935 [Acidobacteria bacterium RIFCSPLOWO2_12_FULL_67_14]|nr:MAG: hypothetical protein A3F70_17935 [Acidobacteria bacterium RIFCSPLOWO2_12_FULL_67_14]